MDSERDRRTETVHKNRPTNKSCMSCTVLCVNGYKHELVAEVLDCV
jgi:hypothetical protein